MVLRVGEIGKLLLVGTEFILSDNTSVGLLFTSPCGGTSFERNTPDCTAPQIPSGELPEVGSFDANTYIQYRTAEDDFAEAGTWTVQAIYEDGTPKKFYGAPAELFINPLG